MEADAGSVVNWTWGDADPYQWRVEASLDGITGWGFYDFVVGSGRTDDGFDDSTYVRVVGVDATNVPVTGFSNVVVTFF